MAKRNDNVYDKNFLLETVMQDEEHYALDKLSFKDFCLYPFKTENLFYTIAIFGAGVVLTNTPFGFFFAIFLNILYGIYLIRKVLNIKETLVADAYLIRFFIYSFFVNIISFVLIAYGFNLMAEMFLSKSHYLIFSLQHSDEHLFMNMLLPIISFTNMALCSDFIITFAIAENRPIYTYFRYKKELTFYNAVSFVCLIFVFVIGINILSFDVNNHTLRTALTIIINLCSSYVILVSMLNWTDFLRKDLYPDLQSEE